MITAASVIAIAFFAFGRQTSTPDPTPPHSPPSSAIGPAASATGISAIESLQGPFPVTRVVDGDTIHVRTSDGDVKVRLIGIDTPETVAPNRPVECFGPEASAEARRLMDGRSVYLEQDSSQDATDKYGRTLAYVWLTRTDMVNLKLIEGGFAREYLYRDPYHHYAQFSAAEQAAQSAGRGLWAACG